MRHLAAALLATTALTAPAGAQEGRHFNRIASFAVTANLPEGMDPATETSPEIIAVTGDGMTVVYSDSPLGAVGMVDISDPANPRPAGVAMLDGEPTAVVTIGQTAFAGVNTSDSFTAPSGHLAVIDVATGAVTRSCDLGGQPDSLAAAPDGSFIAIAIENERDEDLNDGVIPQAPGGAVVIVPIGPDGPDCAAMITADVTGLAGVAPSDPEPEFVDVNAAGEIAVTMQENNHVVILNAAGAVLSHFSAGTVDLQAADVREEGALTFDATLTDVPREPDAVKWLGTDRLVTANEGDYRGGSRGFTIWTRDGEVEFESGMAFDHLAALIGHYPERRSGNKGSEPEGMEVGTFDGVRHIFVLSERGGFIGVYRDEPGEPVLVGVLPSGVGPESAVAIPERGLLVSANEADLGPDGGPRAHVMVYALQDGPAAYPTLQSTFDDDGAPIGFGAISGMVADPETPGLIYAVNDSFYGMQPTIFVIDATQTPARIERAIRVTRDGAPAQKLDLEGIATDGQGGFWLASEGRSDRLIPHALYHVNADGEIEAEIAFPPELLATERRFGSEGVTRVGDRLWIAIQREWADDPRGFVKLVSYDIGSGEWGAVHYPLETPAQGWMGLSEITAHGDFMYIVERDNQIGANAAVKRLYRVAMSEMTPAPIGGDLPVVRKALVRDFIPDLARWGGYIVDKVEGFAIDADGVAYVSTDNDGVDDSSGETFFWSIGPIAEQSALRIEAIEADVYVHGVTLEADEHFGFDSAEISDADAAKLAAFAAIVGQVPDARLVVRGHADRIGDAAYNEDLSLRRAEAVALYLQRAAGLTGPMLIEGVGAAEPLAACDGETGDALKACLAPNRRVEVIFIGEEVIEHEIVRLVAEIPAGEGRAIEEIVEVDLTRARLMQ